MYRIILHIGVESKRSANAYTDKDTAIAESQKLQDTLQFYGFIAFTTVEKEIE